MGSAVESNGILTNIKGLSSPNINQANAIADKVDKSTVLFNQKKKQRFLG